MRAVHSVDYFNPWGGITTQRTLVSRLAPIGRIAMAAALLAEGGHALHVVNERGERFRVGLVDRSVERLARDA